MTPIITSTQVCTIVTVTAPTHEDALLAPAMPSIGDALFPESTWHVSHRVVTPIPSQAAERNPTEYLVAVYFDERDMGTPGRVMRRNERKAIAATTSVDANGEPIRNSVGDVMTVACEAYTETLLEYFKPLAAAGEEA